MAKVCPPLNSSTAWRSDHLPRRALFRASTLVLRQNPFIAWQESIALLRFASENWRILRRGKVQDLSNLSGRWPAISALLDAALDLPSSDRATWLEGLVGEQALYRDTVRALLMHWTQIETDDFLAAPPQLRNVPIDDANDSPQQTVGRLEAGSQVGPYRLLEQIGRGGMASVWLAERADGLVSRRVALKLPHSAWGNTFADRLARERDILATLSHEHIARLYDVGIDELGRPYLAMEFVEGEEITAYCRARDLPLRERIALLLQVMAAMSHAHSRLVVHRDLKPSNILVTKEGQARLLDFGIAKLLEGDRTRQTALTELGGRALTLDYASPEQIRGEPLGTASDVYSLAVVAYEVLAQARPYRLKRGSAAELEEAIAAAEPLLASDAAPSKALRAALRGDIDAILHRGLKKSVIERYPSVDAFAQDFERYLRGEPVRARPDSMRYRADKFVRRHALPLAMSAALSVALVAGTCVALWQAHLAREQERLAMLNSEKQVAVAELYRETLTRVAKLAKDEPAELSNTNAVTGLLLQQLRDRAPRFANRPEMFAPQMLIVLSQLSYGNEFERAVALGKEYLAYLKAHDGKPVEVIEAYTGLSRALYALKRYDECEATRRESLAWAPDAHDGFTDLARLRAMTDLGSILRARGKRDEALAALTAAEALASKKFPDDVAHFENLRILAVFWSGFDDARALQAMERSHDGLLRNGSADDDLKANDLIDLGDIRSAEGRSAQAESALRGAVDLFARMYGRTSGNAVRAIGRLANATALQGDIPRAQRLLDDTLREVAAEPGGAATSQARELRRRRLDIARLTGEPTPAEELSTEEVQAFTAPAVIRANEALLFAQVRVWTLASRARDALALLSALRQHRPELGKPTSGRVQLLELQADAELAAADPGAAQTTARELMTLLEQNDARRGRPYHVATELAAVAAVRLGDLAAAAQALAQADEATSVFPSRVDSADSALRRSEVLSFLSRSADARIQGRAALTNLVGQHPQSPRLALAQRLAAR